MKRFYLALAMLAALPAAASAQTILNEGFETTSTDQYSPNFPDGWSTVDSYTGNNDRYRWNVYYYEKGTMTGTHCASVDGPMFTGGEDGGEGPREEILLTPELNLDGSHFHQTPQVTAPPRPRKRSPRHSATPTDAPNVDKISVICYKIRP